MYKTTVYNNTIINPGHGIGIIGLGMRWRAKDNPDDYKYIFNNIVDGGATSYYWCQEAPITAQMYCDGDLPMNFQHHVVSNNYTYRPKTNQQYRITSTYYTPSQFESQTITTAPRVAYSNSYNAGNLLYKSETGSEAYVTNGSHVIKSGVTIADGGIGGPHPYLDGNLPSYVGATNPLSYGWVAGVRSFANKVANIPVVLRDAVSGEQPWQVAAPKPPTIVP